MLKRAIIGLLSITVLGGAGFAMFDRPEAEIAAQPAAAVVTEAETASQPVASSLPDEEVIPPAPVEPMRVAASGVGEPWRASGTIVDLTAVGMTLALDNGEEIYVELGPESFWRAQDATPAVGAPATVEGFFNGSDYHTRSITLSDGSVLALRDDTGMPLWSGGGGAAEAAGGAQVAADAWVTLEGTVTALTNNGLTIQTTDGQVVTLQFGQANFWQTQAVSFATGDAVSALGFWQGPQFSVGQVTRTATGERILLRDPNGRPLWAGPGRGQSNGAGTAAGGNSGSGAGSVPVDGSLRGGGSANDAPGAISGNGGFGNRNGANSAAGSASGNGGFGNRNGANGAAGSAGGSSQGNRNGGGGPRYGASAAANQ